MLSAALRRAGPIIRARGAKLAAASAAAAALAASLPPVCAEGASTDGSTAAGKWASWIPLPETPLLPFDLTAGLGTAASRRAGAGDEPGDGAGGGARQHTPPALSQGPQAERVFGNQTLEDLRMSKIRKYEEDIRKLSSTEKIFMLFASATDQDTGAVRMTPHDLLRATAGSHLAADAPDAPLSAHAQEFFDAVDLDGDGTISWAEFMLLTTLLAIPPRQLEVAFRMFDKDRSGTIDKTEFADMMRGLRERGGRGGRGQASGTAKKALAIAEAEVRMMAPLFDHRTDASAAG